ncbi:MAG: retron St85 family RNA-directed DNA polymerase [Pseudomonadota bacterium]
MRARFNEDLLLWAIATLQPASAGDAIAFIKEIFPDTSPLPKVKELNHVIQHWTEEGYISRVHGKSRLYSITNSGNAKLSIRLRRHRDKTRIFLLKAAHDAKFEMSGEAQQGLTGVSPVENGSSDIQEGSRPIRSVVGPRRPRTNDRSYWPRVVKQLDFRVGSEPRSPDTFFDYYSFPDVNSIHSASNSLSAPNDLSIIDLGISLGISPRLLTSFIHKPSHHYRQFEIGKRGGGTRTISSPKVFLKVVQYWILDYFLFRLPVSDCCHSYRKHHSILTNASQHVGKRFVGNIDIKDFFQSVKKLQIENLLYANGFGRKLSNSISKLITLDDGLPQGAPTSPLVSNAFLYDLDLAMAEHAVTQGVVYSRYADDITISGDERKSIVDAISYASSILKNKGLTLNDKKTRIASNGGQKRVTGVVVNVKPQPPRKLRRRIRAMFHQAENRPNEYKDKLSQLRGYLSYLMSYPVLRDSAELKKYKKILDNLSQ